MPPVPARPEHYVIVGGTTGSGRVLTRLLSAAGHRITVLGRHEPPESRSSPGVRVERVDLMDTQALRDLATRLFKNGDITNHLILFQRYRDAGDPWLGELATTLTATKLLVECFASQCLTTANHAIVAIGSSAVSFVASEQPVGYHAAKAALAQIIRYYAVQLGPLGVRANLVSPALVLKEESRHSLEADARLMETYKSITPLGRIGLPEDVAQLIIFLCSPAASFITGQDIAVDGGISLAAHASLARTLHESSQTPKPGPS